MITAVPVVVAKSVSGIVVSIEFNGNTVGDTSVAYADPGASEAGRAARQDERDSVCRITSAWIGKPELKLCTEGVVWANSRVIGALARN